MRGDLLTDAGVLGRSLSEETRFEKGFLDQGNSSLRLGRSVFSMHALVEFSTFKCDWFSSKARPRCKWEV